MFKTARSALTGSPGHSLGSCATFCSSSSSFFRRQARGLRWVAMHCADVRRRGHQEPVFAVLRFSSFFLGSPSAATNKHRRDRGKRRCGIGNGHAEGSRVCFIRHSSQRSSRCEAGWCSLACTSVRATGLTPPSTTRRWILYRGTSW